MGSDQLKKPLDYISEEWLSVIVPAIISVILCTGFSWMFISAYDLSVSVASIAFWSLIYSAAFGYCFRRFRMLWSVLILLGAVLIPAGCIAGNVMFSRTALTGLLHQVKLYSFPQIPEIIKLSPVGTEYLEQLFVIVSIIPTAVTMFVFIKFRRIIAVPLLYLPYIMCSLTNISLYPTPGACEVAAAGVILVLLLNSYYKRNRDIDSIKMLKMILPVLLIAVIAGAVFPLSGYRKYELATRFLSSAADFVDNSPLGENKRLRRIIDLAENGRLNNDTLVTVFSDSGSSTDLYSVGFFNPPDISVGNVSYTYNLGFVSEGPVPDRLSYIYLKAASKDIYDGSSWSIADPVRPAIGNGHAVDRIRSGYIITVETYAESDVDLTPYYTDFYTRFDRETVNANSVPVINPMNLTSGRGEVATYDSFVCPVWTGNIYSDTYLSKYVYGTALEVPDSTRSSILDSGVLPQWYLQVLNGESSMTDIEKVRAVTEYVRSLHTYDAATGYPDRDSDFVVWFMTESDTGFCVHYASTAVILLRMIGVPARYVDGYLVSNCDAGRVSEVTMAQAHAWFEFFDPEFGWILGDPTPGNDIPASYYNVEALTAYYPDAEGPRDTADTGMEVTEEPDPSSVSVNVEAEGHDTSDVSELPAANSRPDEDVPGDHSEVITETDPFMLSPGAAAVIAFICILLLAVIIYVSYWEHRFRTGKTNSRAVALFRYLDSNRFVFGGRLPRAASFIAEKATYSNGNVSEDEIRHMVSVCRKRVDRIAAGKPLYLKGVYRLMAAVIMRPCRKV